MNCAYLIGIFIGLTGSCHASVSKPIDIVKKDRFLDVPKEERSRSLPVLESQLFRRSRTPSPSTPERPAEPELITELKVRRYSSMYIKGVQRKLYLKNLWHYIGGYVYHDPEYQVDFEIQNMFVGDKATADASPLEYIHETVQVMRLLGYAPGFQFFPNLVDPHALLNGQRYIVNEFRQGISFENIFNTPADHPFPDLMMGIRTKIFENFHFYLAQLITIFEVLSDNGVFNGKVKLSNISILANGNLEMPDLRAAFRPELQKRKHVTASMPYASPEVRTGKHVGAYSHFFSLGAMLYELTTGRPFHLEELDFPDGFNEDLEEIISHLLTVNYERRIGALSKVKTNRYFKDINWKAMLVGDAEPPIQLKFDQSD